MKKLLLLLLGLLLIFILSYFCFMGKSEGIKEDLLGKATTIYSDKSMDWVTSEIEGNDLEATRIITLTGTATNASERERAEEVAQGIEGITSVNNQIRIAPPSIATSSMATSPDVNSETVLEKKDEVEEKNEVEEVVALADPYTMSITKREDNKITLSGYLPDVETHRALIAQAEEIYGEENVTDALKEAPNAPIAWSESVALGMVQLAEVDYGHVKMKDETFAFEGYVGSEVKKREILHALKSKLTSNYDDSYAIEAPTVEVIAVTPTRETDATPSVALEQEPMTITAKEEELESVNLSSDEDDVRDVEEESLNSPKEEERSSSSSAVSCQERFKEHLSKEKINFAYNRATIKRESFKLLDSLIEIAQGCPTDTIVIEGHTDSDGSQTYNQKLSERRANAVKVYLIEHGITKERLESVGYGELHPIATNRTKAGKRENRRIEFNVKGVE